MTRLDLHAEVNRFTAETRALLAACFSEISEPDIESRGDRVVTKVQGHLLGARGDRLAELHVFQRFCLDSAEKYLAVEQSVFKVSAAVIVRYDYDRHARSKPSSHIQIHAHRGAVSHVLSQSGHPKPHALESLHFPTGGARFRPALEDLLEFLIRDCRFQAKQGWEAAIRDGRERSRRRQVRAVVRDVPSEAVDVLTDLGYKIEPPEKGPQSDNAKALATW
ncbi:hypothetical protein [Saccharomonospora piscinae]|uniref:hypothetical protein n=1 Tax=Saccharomonospora piscinae TaxID=687388 RepID=UPI0004AED6EA|nr:hypothetical protein [Saccharomonospora piscinae]